MDVVLVSIGILCMFIGIIGSFMPVLPGPALSWFGLLFLYLTDAVPINYWVLGITAVLVIIITILDFVIPARGTKLYGGSKYGIWGTNIGLVIGIFAPIPFGFLIGPFVGAFIGELLYNSTDHHRALKAATGSFLGFLASTFMKFLVCVLFLGFFISIAWEYRKIF